MVDTTTTTLTEAVNSEVINDIIQDYLADVVVAVPHGLHKDISGEATLTAAFPQWVSDTASFEEPSEGADLTPVALETEQETPITVGQMGLAREFTMRAGNSSKLNMAELEDYAVSDGSRALGLALDDDFVDLFASFTNSVGTTTEALDVDDMASAIGQLGKDNANIPGAKIFVLSGNQNKDLMVAYTTSQGSALTDFLEVGGDNPSMSGRFMGIPIKYTNQNATANLGADHVGALFADGSDPANARHAAIAVVTNQMPRAIFDEQVLSGNVIVSVFADWAAGMVEPTRGVQIVTDAG